MRPTLLLFASLVPACAGDPLPPRAASAEAWVVVKVLDARAPLRACAVGELDPRHPGHELAALTDDGEVFVARGLERGTRWASQRVASLAGEAVGCVVHAGGLVVAGARADGTGVVQLLEPGGRSWTARELFTGEAAFTAVCVAGTAAGRLLVVGDAAGDVWTWDGAEPDAPRALRLPAGPRSAITDLVPLAGGVAAASADGVRLLLAGADGWTAGPWYAGGAPGLVGSAGERVVRHAGDGRLEFLDAAGIAAPGPTLGAPPRALSGLALGAGLALAVADDAGRLQVQLPVGDGWLAVVPYTDDQPFLRLRAADLGLGAPGPELVACGASGRLILAAPAAE